MPEEKIDDATIKLIESLDEFMNADWYHSSKGLDPRTGDFFRTLSKYPENFDSQFDYAMMTQGSTIMMFAALAVGLIAVKLVKFDISQILGGLFIGIIGATSYIMLYSIYEQYFYPMICN